MSTQNAELVQKMEAIKASVSEFTGKAKSLVVTNDAQEVEAIEALGAGKKRIKRVEELRKFFTAPLNAQLKSINAMFKCQSEPLKEVEKILKAKLIAYGDEKEARLIKEREEQAKKDAAALKKEQEAAAELAAEEAKSRKPSDPIPVVEPPKPVEVEPIEAPEQTVRTDSGSATRKKVWTWKVKDEKRLREVRPDLFVLDEKAVNQLVRDGVREVEGLDIYQDTQLSIR